MKSVRPGDVCLGLAGCVLAAASAFLPWHVYNNPARFGPPQMRFSNTSISALTSPEDVAMRTGRFEIPSDAFGIDPIITSSIGRDPAEQKPPKTASVADYRLQFVSGGRALVHDSGSLTLVTTGSRLSGGERVVSLARDGLVWSLHLDTGAVLRWKLAR